MNCYQSPRLTSLPGIAHIDGPPSTHRYAHAQPVPRTGADTRLSHTDQDKALPEFPEEVELGQPAVVWYAHLFQLLSDRRVVVVHAHDHVYTQPFAQLAEERDRP